MFKKNNKSFNLFVNPLALWRSLRYIKNQSKFYQKSLKNHPKIHQKSTKIHQKSTKNLLKSALGASWAPRGPKTPPRPFQARKQEEKCTPPGHPFGRLFRPCWPPRAIKRAFKKHTKFSLIWKSIFHRFSSILAGFWKDLGPKLASKIH